MGRLNGEALKRLLQPYSFNNLYYRRPAVLQREGCVPKYAYYVARGFVLVYGYDPECNTYVRAIYDEHSFLALNCFMLQQQSEYTIIACADTLVWRISYPDMERARRGHADCEDIFWRASAECLESAEALKNGLRSQNPENRVFAFYRKFPCLLPPRKSIVKSRDIASYLLLSHDQLKRFRIRLRDKQLLRY
ncbi:Crp/Fnr family transcriptional regulator [Pedobacter faecalis]|uniref:Crp/Fnr family transcriptional regulator n=1 Tax=Pedobacter faecalis TaxID=3041495 RepID=UPI00254DC239|nr:cyclic nucleotide-binding domain-containing protein [Pedobacter sp. ELA7]